MYNLRIALLLLGASSLAAATEVWRWVDQDGVVHLSDKPVPGATRIQVQAAPSTASGAAAQPYRAPPPSPVPATKPAQGPAYTSCKLVEPADDRALDAPESVQLTVQPLPALRPGDRISVTLNGAAIADWNPASPTYTLQQPDRGSYSVQVRITSYQGQAMCSSPASVFHVRQPSVIRQQRRKP
jgi:hypothetical protein